MYFDNYQQTDSVTMDFFAPTNGLPSESKLVTYMSRQNVTTPTYGLSAGLSNVILDSPRSSKKVQVTPQSPEFIPSQLNSSPSFYQSFSSVIVGNTSAKGKNITPILGISNAYSATPIKGRNLVRGDSPHSSESPKVTPQSSPPPNTVPPGIHQEYVGGTTYFYPTANHTPNQVTNSVGADHSNGHDVEYNLPGQVYSGPASNVVDMLPQTQLSAAFFMPDEMRSEIQRRNDIANIMDTQSSDLPVEIENYHSLYPLENQSGHVKMQIQSTTYKGTNVKTGVKYCLRRLHGFRLQSTKCMAVVEHWKKLHHSNVVQLREVFTTKRFNDHSLVLVYDYHPGSQTLVSKYFTPTGETNGFDPFQGDARPLSYKGNLQRSPNGPLLAENEIWAIIIQLTAGLRAIHQAGLACRTLDPTKIIVTGKRVRFSFVGISDIIYFDPNQSNPMAMVSNYQQEDLHSLGKLILALACRNVHSVHEDNIQNSIAQLSRHFSVDLRNVICQLLSPSRRSVTDLMPMIGARFYMQLDALQSKCDKQDDELAKELDNGRLYRLLIKLGCINERPELNMDVTWSETGDRYMLKLFRDYLFHSVTADGRPWLDHAHIVQSLNKLDAGTVEKVQLISRDEQSILVVTYAELKHCLEQAFSELIANT